MPIVAVSPIIGGKAIKGPTDKIMDELGLSPTSQTIAAHYADFLDGLVIDTVDAADQSSILLPVMACATLMKTDEDRIRLAREVLAFARDLDAAKERQ